MVTHDNHYLIWMQILCVRVHFLSVLLYYLWPITWNMLEPVANTIPTRNFLSNGNTICLETTFHFKRWPVYPWNLVWKILMRSVGWVRTYKTIVYGNAMYDSLKFESGARLIYSGQLHDSAWTQYEALCSCGSDQGKEWVPSIII